MEMKTLLARRVKNTSLPKTHALLPLLEAVVNGIQAIDARYGDDVNRGSLRVMIDRSSQEELAISDVSQGRPPLRSIEGFTISDNGVGFTPDNMSSFTTLDSDFKAELGCRGVGRLLWLKAFERVEVKSTFRSEDGLLQGRSFRFSVEREVEQDTALDAAPDAGSVVRLIGFKERYQQSAPKTVEAIARQVFEHCIWYFLRPGGAPDVIISDDGGESIALRDLLEESGSSEMMRASLDIKRQQFDLLGLRLKPSARNANPRLHWCAANRVVRDENIAGKVPGLYGKLKDQDSVEFTYVCYLSSRYLDDHVRADRTEFDLPERVPGETLIDDPSLDDIRQGVFAEISRILAGPLECARQEAQERIHEFVSTKAPKYRPLINRIKSRDIAIDPSIKDQDLELELHRISQKFEAELLVEGQAVFADAGGGGSEGYDERLADYLEKVKDLNQSDLASYVSRRRVTLDILAQLIQSDGDGKYAREEAIHRLLFPMRKESTDIASDSSNLWILDERLVFHDYLASDTAFKRMKIVNDDSRERPDILCTRVIEPDAPVLTSEGNRLPLQSIVFVELKRPMRDDASEGRNPIEQCLNYVGRVREGTVTTAAGRPIPRANESPAFCYIIADLTPKMIDRCKLSGLLMTHDGMGYFGFLEPYKAYVEVMSYDRLTNAAIERNRAFFDKLGLPSS